jgi:hypothetical protein
MLDRLASRTAPAVAVALGVAACGGSNPMTPPPVVNNAPPSITSLAVPAARAEANRPIQVTAVVTDAETPIDQLTYTWSASPANGTFSGGGASTTWTPPRGQKTPDVYTITLTVAERYTSAGQSLQNSVSRSTTINYNDSPLEALTIGVQFIKDFGTFSVSPDECVRNFSNSCRGKQEERDQIAANREAFRILSAEFSGVPAVTFNTELTAGTVEGPCVFEDIPNSGPNAGRRQRVSGTCHLTTIYENFRWYLCDSFFLEPYNTVLLNLRSRAPGRVVGRLPHPLR